MNNNQEDIVILAFVQDLWLDPWQPRHFILSGLAESYKVLWISRPLYWIDILKKKASPRTRLIKVTNRFLCYAPLIPADYVLPHHRSRMPMLLRKIYHYVWLFFHTLEIKYLLRQLSAKKVILYLWQPYFLEQIGRFHENLLCYHIDDDYQYDSVKDNPISEQERLVLEKSDIVFIHSKTLLEKKGNINKNTYYVPNGVDFNLYRKAIQRTPKIPADMVNIRRPILGYAGWIKKHLNLDLLLTLAQTQKEWSIVLVGPIRHEHKEILHDIELLRREDNVHFLGLKKLQQLPLYINAMDVCLMPYRITPYTKYIYPLKLHEYLACGKAIVATHLPNLEEFSSQILLADRDEQWIPLIEKALKEDNPAKAKTRIETARNNSWAERANTIQSIFNRYLQK